MCSMFIVSCFPTKNLKGKCYKKNLFEEYLCKFSPIELTDSICLDCVVFETNTNDTSIQLGKIFLSELSESNLPLFKSFPAYVITCSQGYLAFLLHFYDCGLLIATYIDAISYSLDGKIIGHRTFPAYNDYGGFFPSDAVINYSSIIVKDSILRYRIGLNSQMEDTITTYYQIDPINATLSPIELK